MPQYRLGGAGIRAGVRVAVLFDDAGLAAALRDAGAVPVPVAAPSSERLRWVLGAVRAHGVVVDSEARRRDVLDVCADLAELDHVWHHADLLAPATQEPSWPDRLRRGVIDNPLLRRVGAILRRRRRRGGD